MGVGCILNRVIREGLTGKVALERRLEWSEGANQTKSRGRAFQAQEPASAKAPGQEGIWLE